MNLALQALPQIASFIFLASVKATLLVLLVLLIQRLAVKYLSAGARYLLWATVVIGLVTPIGFDTAMPAGLMPIARETALPAPRSGESDTPEARYTDILIPAEGQFAAFVDARETATVEAAPLAWFSLLPYLWLAGVMAVCAAIAVSGFRFSRLVRRAAIAPLDLQAFLQDCMRQTGCKIAVTVLHSAEVQVPMIAGLFTPVLLMPTGLEQQVSRAQLRHVFIHELMHLQRGDIVSNWVVALVQALHWFNPAVWFAFFCMRQDRELACDAATLKHLAPSDHAAYGHTLLQLNDALPQTSVPALALGILDSPSDLQRRILMLVQSSRYKKLQSFIATVLFLPLAAVAFSQPTPRVPEPVAAVEPAIVMAEPAIVIAAEPANGLTEPAPAIVETVPAMIEPAPLAAPVEVRAPTEPAQPLVREARTFDALVPNTALLAQLAATPTTDPFAVAAGTNELAATTTQVPSAEPDADLLAELQSFAQIISANKASAIPFIEELETAATECAARGDGIFDALSAPCTQTRRALRRGQIFNLGYGCFALNAKQEALATRRREAGAQSRQDAADALLRENEQSLAAFCSDATYRNNYPAFAALFAEGKSPKYYAPGERRRLAMTGEGRPARSGFYDATWSNMGDIQGQSSGGLDANSALQSTGAMAGYSNGVGGVGGGGDAGGGGAAAPSTPAP